MLNLKPENAGLIRDTMGFAWNLTKITPDDLDRIIDAARAEGQKLKTFALETHIGMVEIIAEPVEKPAPAPDPCQTIMPLPPSRARLDAIARKAGKIVDGPCLPSDIRRLADLIGQLTCVVEARRT